MSDTQDTPKFTVINRRKWLEEDGPEEAETPAAPAQPAEPAPRMPAAESAPQAPAAEPPRPRLVEMPEPKRAFDEAAQEAEEDLAGAVAGPTQEESSFQKMQYEQSAERLETLVRAQNPGAPAMEKIGFEHLVQQLYLSALMQMGAGTPEGQRPRVDILGAKQTIDLMGVLQEKTVGNLNDAEKRTLDTALYELRMTFLELTRMISLQTPPPPGGAKH